MSYCLPLLPEYPHVTNEANSRRELSATVITKSCIWRLGCRDKLISKTFPLNVLLYGGGNMDHLKQWTGHIYHSYKHLSLLWWRQTPETIESLDLGNVDVLLQLPSTVLVRKRPPADKIMSDFFIGERIRRHGHVQHTFNFHVVWVKRLLLLDL